MAEIYQLPDNGSGNARPLSKKRSSTRTATPPQFWNVLRQKWRRWACRYFGRITSKNKDMDIKKAIKICKEHQKWRREKPPYDGETPEKHRAMPYTAKEYGIALDSLIKFAEETVKAQTFFAGLNAAKESFKNVRK